MSTLVHTTGADEIAPRVRPLNASAWKALSLPDGTQLMVLAFAFCGFVAAAFAPQLLWDGDTFWHVATGQWMWRHHQVLGFDPFSFSSPGIRWVNLEWLSDVVMGPVYGAGGWSAIDLLFASALGLLTWLLATELSRKLPPFSCAAALFLALSCTTQSWLARPHVLALPILAFWTIRMLRAREADRAPSLWLLPLMTAWANLHGSYLFGLALIGPFALEALCDAAPSERLRVFRDWAVFGMAAGAAALLTPHGIDGPLYTLKLITMKSLPDIVEWQSSNFAHLGPLEVTLLTTLFILLYRGVKVPIIRLITLLGLLHLTLNETRHQMIMAVTGVLLLAEPMGRALASSAPALRLPQLSRMVRASLLGVIVAAFAGVALARTLIPARLTEVPTAPLAAFAHVPEGLRRQPVLNEYGAGGYLILNGVKPFIDGRADMYGDDFVQAYVKAKSNPVRLKALIARYGFRWTLLAADNPAVAILDSTPGWKRIYGDKVAVVHVRTGS